MYTFILNKNSHKNETNIVKTVMRIYFTSVDREHSDQSAYIECIFTPFGKSLQQDWKQRYKAGN